MKDIFAGRIIGQTKYVSIDGIDFSIYDRTPFDLQWYSFKLNKPKYEAYSYMCFYWIYTLVWRWLQTEALQRSTVIARLEFTSMLLPGEKAMADRIYNDQSFFITPYTPFLNSKLLSKNIAARQENVNH